jgi:NAD-dependent SIR2 family protein deacetylase
MHSKRSLEGYLIIDDRLSGGGLKEMATLTCSHCHRQIAVHPLRTRERNYCRKCDHYICDDCALVAKLNGGECNPLTAVFDREQERLFRAR